MYITRQDQENDSYTEGGEWISRQDGENVS